jgi:hypothetical protein
MDLIKTHGIKLVGAYNDFMSPSKILAPIDIFMKSKTFKNYAPVFIKIVSKLYEVFKDFESDTDKQKLLDIVKAISLTEPQEKFDVTHPDSGDVICTLYTPEDKMLANDVLKNLSGNINYNPLKFKVKKKANSQEYKDTWNKVIKVLDKSQFDDETLDQLRNAINNA